MPRDQRMNKGGPVTFLGMYSRGRLTGTMPGDIQAMHDGINEMLQADPNCMAINQDNIVAKREEIAA